MYSSTNTVSIRINSFVEDHLGKASKDRSVNKDVTTLSESCQKRILVLYVGGVIGKNTKVNQATYYIQNSLESYLRRVPIMCDNEYSSAHLSEADQAKFIVLPAKKSENRVLYHIAEFDIIEPSSNVTLEHWKKIAVIIGEAYEEYDGFVIIHGTDTMPYTASALSFMLENLGKTVIVTGSQIPVFESRSDGRDNIVGALIIAGNFTIPEVTVYFKHRLYRGNRIVKRSTDALHAFESPRMLPLADVGVNIDLNWKAILNPSSNGKFHVHSILNPNVNILRLFPNITIQSVRSHLEPPVEGVVLHTYGAGEVPNNRSDILDELKKASERGIIIVNCTQCLEGSVNEDKEAVMLLLKIGVISGGDMTVEAALTKLSYVLSKNDWDQETRLKMIQLNLRGELTFQNKDGSLGEADILKFENQSRTIEIVLPHLIYNYIVEGNINKLKDMKAFNANFCIEDSELRTPLHIACCEGKEDIVEYLLLNGASVHSRDIFDNTPLMDAILFDKHSIIKKLVKCGAHLVSNQPKLIGEELCMAAIRGNVKRLQSFQLAGADLSQADFSGNTALHLAVQHANEEVVKYLTSVPVHISTQNFLGETPCDIAQRMNHKGILELLK